MTDGSNDNRAEAKNPAPGITGRRILKPAARIACFLLVCALVWVFISYMLVPKDGTAYNTKTFDSLPKDTVDAIFVGASGFWDGISPLTMWSETGITSYVFAASNCPPQISYLMLKEALKKQHPKVVFFSPQYLVSKQHNEQISLRVCQGLINRRLTLDKLYASALIAKDNGIKTGVAGLFPLFVYHDNWRNIQEVTFERQSDGAYMGQRCWSFFNEEYKGTKQDLMDRALEPARPFEYNPVGAKYYRKMIALCKAEGVKPVLLTLPHHLASVQFEPDRRFAEKEGADVIDLNEPQYLDVIDINNKTEWRDQWHVNFWGSIKLSKWFGPFIRDKYSLPDRRSASDISSKIWLEHYSVFYENLYWLEPGGLNEPGKILLKG